MTVGGPQVPNLRALLLVGDFFLGGVIATSLTKLLLRLRALGAAAPVLNRTTAQGMLAIISIMRLGESPALPTPLDGKQHGLLLLLLFGFNAARCVACMHII